MVLNHEKHLFTISEFEKITIYSISDPYIAIYSISDPYIAIYSISDPYLAIYSISDPYLHAIH